MYNDIYFLYIQSGGSVGSTVVVTDVVGALVVVGGTVVGTGFASGGVKTQFSKYLNSISSTATNPFPLFLRPTTNWICQMIRNINSIYKWLINRKNAVWYIESYIIYTLTWYSLSPTGIISTLPWTHPSSRLGFNNDQTFWTDWSSLFNTWTSKKSISPSFYKRIL